MLAKIVFVFTIVLMIVAGNPLQSMSSRLDDATGPLLEEGCARQGGICLPIEDCDPGNLVQLRGVLCSNHYHINRECCYV